MVQSTTKPACCNALTTGPSRWIASLAPVERIGTTCWLRGVGTTMWNGLRAHAQQRQFGDVHVERTRLRLGEDRSGVARLHGAAFEHLAERVDPFRLHAICDMSSGLVPGSRHNVPAKRRGWPGQARP